MKQPSGQPTRKRDAEWRRVCSALTHDSVRIGVPRAFLSILTLFFHHVSDAMAGDDRPDHGLAKMRQGREHYSIPFYFIYGKLKRAEDSMSEARHRKAVEVFSRYLELLEERDKSFREAVKRRAYVGNTTEREQGIRLKPVREEPRLLLKHGVLVCSGTASGTLTEAVRTHREARLSHLARRLRP